MENRSHETSPGLTEPALAKEVSLLQTRGMVRHEAKGNRRRQQLPERSLIVGIDIGKTRHAAWMIDPGMRPLARAKIAATPAGVDEMLSRAERAQKNAQLDHIVVAFEPTSHYWMLLANCLEQRGVDYLVVHPISVWRGREIREYSYAKDDFKDASLIAELAAQFHFTQARLREPLWQTMRSLAYERFGLVELRSRALQETRSHLDVVFPNYPVIHRLSRASKTVLSGDPDPTRIAAMPFEDFVAETRKGYEGGRLSRSTLVRIHEAAQRSWGLGSRGAGSKIRLALAMQRQQFMAAQVAELDRRLLELYDDTGYAGIAETMPGMSSITAAMLLSLSGDPGEFDSGRCLAKLAGFNARENESGEFKGSRGITGRGNPILRTIAFRAAVSLAKNNPEFKSRLFYLMCRRSNPMTRRQAYVALANKVLRTLHTMWVNKEPYDPDIATGRKPPTLLSERHED
jgi:transposase